MRNPFIFEPETFESYSGTPSGSEQLEGAWLEAEFDQEGEARTGATPSRVQARILWPALGFPAVITPSARPSANTLRDGDATKCICVLVLSDKRQLTSQDAARYLRCVPWASRGRRHIAENSFAATELSVRNDVNNALTIAGRTDAFGEHVRFGANGRGQNGIVACLAGKVRKLYSDAGLTHLHEIRVSEEATARLQFGRYHLFWNNENANEAALSDELQLLVDRYARQRRANPGKAWEKYRDRLLKEYTTEYGGLHSPYIRQQHSKPKPAEILHPLFVCPSSATLRISHVTDTHVDVRADVYEQNLNVARVRTKANKSLFDAGMTSAIIKGKGDYNNFNKSFKKVYDDAKVDSDVLLMTGDLIDYGRGHWGFDRPEPQLQDDSAYHTDRNWFLFHYLLASNNSYTRPTYTILGNHDWRLNPYPPFAPGASNPNELLNDHLNLTEAEQKEIIVTAHGPGSKRGFSYTARAEGVWQLLLEKTLSAFKALVQLFGQTSKLEQKGFPTETSSESIAWYLFSINPFLDYAFTLPGKQSVLMLDWAEDEAVLFPLVRNGERSGYNPLSPGDAKGTPVAHNSLTGLQHKLVADFVSGPSRAKVIGVHAPPISPQSDWYDIDVFRSKKTYADPEKARGPKGGHPLFAVPPSRHVTTPYGMVADRGSWGKEKERDWFIRMLGDSKYSVRMVLAGHVHRNGVYIVHGSSKPIDIVNPKDPSRKQRLVNPLIVGGLHPQSAGGAPPFVTASGRKGPLYITTTSAGPRGSFEKRALTPKEDKAKGTTTDPGYTRLELANDGTVRRVRFVWGLAPAEKPGTPSTPQREVAFAMR